MLDVFAITKGVIVETSKVIVEMSEVVVGMLEVVVEMLEVVMKEENSVLIGHMSHAESRLDVRLKVCTCLILWHHPLTFVLSPSSLLDTNEEHNSHINNTPQSWAHNGRSHQQQINWNSKRIDNLSLNDDSSLQSTTKAQFAYHLHFRHLRHHHCPLHCPDIHLVSK